MASPLTIRCENITEEVAQKYRDDGYRLVFQEYVMEHDLQTIPEVEISSSFVFKSWSQELQKDFYAAYYASFKDRPGFPEWSMEKWIDWVSASPTFRPDLSYIADSYNRTVGFIATDNDPEFPDTHGFIIQVGVIPEWRRKGIASILTTRCLEAFRGDGKDGVILHVNKNNFGAISLYKRLGFKIVRTKGIFEK